RLISLALISSWFIISSKRSRRSFFTFPSSKQKGCGSETVTRYGFARATSQFDPRTRSAASQGAFAANNSTKGKNKSQTPVTGRSAPPLAVDGAGFGAASDEQVCNG